MERVRHILEILTKDHGILSVLHFIPVAFLSLGQRGTKTIEPDILGDNAPYTITEKIKKLGPRG